MKKIKVKALSVVLAAVFGLSFAGCGGKISVNIPEYNSQKKIDFIAYGSPTNPNWNGTAGNADGLTLESYQLLADGGFTQCQPLFEGYLRTGGSIEEQSAKAEEDAMKALALCEQVGLKYCVRDWTFMGFILKVDPEDYDSVLEKMFSEDNPYIHHPNYVGNNLHDEPTIQQLEQMLPVVRKYKELVPNGECFINLEPIYANLYQLDENGDTTYKDYVKYYCDRFADLLGYVSYDYYPLYKSNYTDSYVKDTYLQNFEIVAREAKERDIEFRIYIQTSCAFPGSSRDAVGVQDYRFQIYTSMAFGVTSFMYYTYSQMNSNKPAIVDINCQPTYRYYAAKTVNNEVHAFENVYTSFKWDNYMVFEGDPMHPCEAFNYLEEPLETHDRIKKVKVSQDTVIGTFKDAENRDGFMIVNYSDPYFDKIDDVTVTFNNAAALLMYRYGQKIVVPLNADGSYTFKLEPGEGRFVIPLAKK